MGILNWWRKRQGILIEGCEPEFGFVSVEHEQIIVRSCLRVKAVIDKVNDEYPPPKGLVWSLSKIDETHKRGCFLLTLKLLEDNYGYKESRQVTEV